MESEDELEKRGNEIRKNLFLVFIPIVILIIGKGVYDSNSLEYNKKRYFEAREASFSGKIIKKRQDGDYPRAERYVLLDNYHKENVEFGIYYKLNIGDSVYKKKDSDSVYFCLKNGEILIIDCNRFYREKYNKLLKNN
ncbi:hypothetical protein ACSV4D_14695 [Flavobacterium sp. ARAG 55.4]|uniref:Uncharacterized protein n=1 Tax=Flavobacterium plantiphilum TaxID=3163297 RepID=A0ABW8XNX8_9FLAO